MFHNSEDVKVSIDDGSGPIDYSLQEAINGGMLGGGGVETAIAYHAS
ncbi:MAG: hypothetical protein ABIH37_02380 [archaeon]